MAIDVFKAKAENMSAAEASTAGRNWAVSRGISTDKARLLRGEATQVVEHRHPQEIWSQLERLVPASAVEGTAEEEEEPPELPPAA
jgi:hypothetical protein